jgi:hypothetical protein
MTHPEIKEPSSWESILSYLTYCRNLSAAHQSQSELGSFPNNISIYLEHIHATRSDRYKDLMEIHHKDLAGKSSSLGQVHHSHSVGDIELLGIEKAAYTLLGKDKRPLYQWLFTHRPHTPDQEISTAWEAIIIICTDHQEGTGQINQPLKYLVEARWIEQPVNPNIPPDQVLIYTEALESRDYTSVTVREKWPAVIISRDNDAEKEGLQQTVRIGFRPSRIPQFHQNRF